MRAIGISLQHQCTGQADVEATVLSFTFEDIEDREDAMDNLPSKEYRVTHENAARQAAEVILDTLGLMTSETIFREHYQDTK